MDFPVLRKQSCGVVCPFVPSIANVVIGKRENVYPGQLAQQFRVGVQRDFGEVKIRPGRQSALEISKRYPVISGKPPDERVVRCAVIKLLLDKTAEAYIP
jgi:hypothetical protein